ncbi:MAG TPA: TIGR03435 family protein [Vicinamibacterales bacterium]|nr:TIGR03435 family protein [Vicinamibacterales bacterium]
MARVTGAMVAVVLLSATLAGQQGAPTFEVASIRPSGNTNAEDHSEVQPSGQFLVTNTRLADLLRVVFDVQPHELVFGERLPSWVDSERWDIIGKGPPISDEVAQRPLLLAMMRNLLIERFKLVTRREVRDGPAYALVVARADRGLGPQMRPSTADCAALAAAFKASGARRTPDSPVCGLSRLRGRFRGTGVRLTELVRLLAPAAGRPVVDATGLTGAFDLDLTFTPVDAPDPAVGGSLFTAIQEQLGLRLEPRQAPMNRLVIESAERPTPD